MSVGPIDLQPFVSRNPEQPSQADSHEQHQLQSQISQDAQILQQSTRIVPQDDLDESQELDEQSKRLKAKLLLRKKKNPNPESNEEKPFIVDDSNGFPEKGQSIDSQA